MIHTDSAVAITDFEKVKAYCCSAQSEGADIWARIWSWLGDFGSFQLRKVKAHTTARDAVEGLISAADQAGNAAADFFAVQAWIMAQRESPVHSFEAHYARAPRWYSLVFRAIGYWKNDALADVAEESNDGQVQNQRIRPEIVRKGARHEVWQLQDGWVCRACGKRFGSDTELAALAKKQCPGPRSARLFDSMGVAPTFSRFAQSVAELTRAGVRRWEHSSAPAGSADGGEGNPNAEVRRPRRRITGKQPDPYECRPAVKEDWTGHLLVSKGRLTFCDRCGR